VRLGVGRGYQTRELETFGAPVLDQDANRDLFEEQVEILVKAFNQESFSHKGRYYTIPPPVPFGGQTLKEITLVPPPRTLPVEIWQPMVSRTPRGLDFMAKHGIKGFAGPNPALATAWQETLARHGRQTELGGDLLFSMGGFIADTPEQAFRQTRVWREEVLKRHAAEGFPRRLTPEQVAILSDPSTAPSIDVNLDERGSGALYGPPELMVERLLEVQEQYPGVEEVNFGPGECAPLAVFLEQLELFGREVIPAFRKQQARRIPAGAD
jgi:alkanesulfonate monooxygenase SsuD/methylene tetrahydromethanopterin reductase-like flavin-dependent oxidoreductase (luciferase family)